jgi:hypothetical protein
LTEAEKKYKRGLLYREKISLDLGCCAGVEVDSGLVSFVTGEDGKEWPKMETS